jgi:predicted HAD superfamily Cof-like phosphohydrolase
MEQAVDQNNLAKFGPGGHRREDGKWVKPPDHKPPDIAGLLDKLAKGQS